ncbi:MAG: ATP synthase F1 subunit epsilon [Flavobacteriales bacterium]|nr:ATP synthase F1 subunit epsilon [Flavobacteriales bacterium]
MNIEIVTPDKEIFAGEVDTAVFPGTNGSFGILKGHAPMICTLQEGTIVLHDSKGEKNFNIGGGIVEILNDHIIVLAE